MPIRSTKPKPNLGHGPPCKDEDSGFRFLPRVDQDLILQNSKIFAHFSFQRISRVDENGVEDRLGEIPASLAAAAAEAARNKPVSVPSDTLFVSGLNKRTTNEKLHEAFSKFGQVVHAKVATDRNNGYSKGYGFVKYATVEEAAKGIEGMDAKFLEGWVIFAEYARPRPSPGQDRPQDVNGARNRW